MSTSGEGAELKEKQNESTTTLLPRLEALKRQRAGKKQSITIRIKQIKHIIAERGSRTRITSLFNSLLAVKRETERLNSDVLSLSHDSLDWIDDIEFDIDDCKSQIEEYLDDGKADTASYVGSWVNDQQAWHPKKLSYDGGLNDLSKTFSDMTLDPNLILNNPQEIKTVLKEHNPDPALLKPEEEKVFKDVKFDDRCQANFSSRVDDEGRTLITQEK